MASAEIEALQGNARTLNARLDQIEHLLRQHNVRQQKINKDLSDLRDQINAAHTFLAGLMAESEQPPNVAEDRDRRGGRAPKR